MEETKMHGHEMSKDELNKIVGGLFAVSWKNVGKNRKI